MVSPHNLWSVLLKMCFDPSSKLTFRLFVFLFTNPFIQCLIFVPQDDDSDDDGEDDDGEDEDGSDNDEKHNENNSDSSSSSSSDTNDSAAAAHAAAIGHSPQPVPIKAVLPAGSSEAPDKADEGKEAAPAEIAESEKKEESKEAPAEGAPDNPAAGETAVSMAISPKAAEQAPADNENGEGVANGETTPDHKASKQKNKKTKYYCPHNLNERDSDENTALHIAIHSRKNEHVKLLVEAGANVHKRSDGSPPIHAAISMGSVPRHAQFAYECVVALSEGGADLSSKDEAMHTPLYLACMYNLPQIVSYILSIDVGQSTLNMRADRSGGRALHAAAKFDTLSNLKFNKGAAALVTGHARIPAPLHHPDGTVANALHHIPGFPGKLEAVHTKDGAAPTPPSTQALLTQVLLGTPGVEVEATNSVGQSPLHVACLRGNWSVVRLLLEAGSSAELPDRRGYTPGQHAHKRGMPIPNDLLEALGGPPSSGIVAPPRDLIVDPESTTLVLTHELCILHRSCPPIRRDSVSEPPPENVRRLSVLVDEETGILRTGEFSRCAWENETRRAAIVDVLKVRPHLSILLYLPAHAHFRGFLFLSPSVS
jgi:ankyrin repeat protein